MLRLIQFSAESAAAAGIPVSICGEMAGDERLTPLLLGLGIAELSMAAGSIPQVKKRVRNLNLAAISGRARRVTTDANPGELRPLSPKWPPYSRPNCHGDRLAASRQALLYACDRRSAAAPAAAISTNVNDKTRRSVE